MKITITNEDSNVEIAISYDDRSVEPFNISFKNEMKSQSSPKGVGKAHVSRCVFPDYVVNLYNSQRNGVNDNDLTTATFMYASANNPNELKTVSLKHMDDVTDTGFTVHDDNGVYRSYRFDRITTDPVIG